MQKAERVDRFKWLLGIDSAFDIFLQKCIDRWEYLEVAIGTGADSCGLLKRKYD